MNRANESARLPAQGRTEIGLALASAVALWAAFPPCGLWFLAWVAPLGWLRLISRSRFSLRRPYLWLYLAGLIHWLALVQWIRLPHWSAYFGWLALAGYLAVYVPLFIGASRVMVHHWGWSSVIAAPVVWTGLELARGYMLTGFSMSLLGHSQVDRLALVQIASLCGAYGVSFLVMLVAASLERAWPLAQRPRAAWPTVIGLAVVALAWGIGHHRLQATSDEANGNRVRVALIQGVYDTQFGTDSAPSITAFWDYQRLSRQAVRDRPNLDLIVWPESMLNANAPMVSFDEPLRVVPGWTRSVDDFRRHLEILRDESRTKMQLAVNGLTAPLLAGVGWDHVVDGRVERFNSAVLVDPDGSVIHRYDKMHPVMFGEYVPLGNMFPWLYRLTPMPDGLTAGTSPQCWQIGKVRFSPCICFENTVPHLIRRQVRTLTQQGFAPDVLVCVTNDGWFWGSSLLDVHLACGVFRAVEAGRPMLIAANTGFSAWIDRHGTVVSRGPRRQEAILVADVKNSTGVTPYYRYGDWPAGCCLFLTLAALVFGAIRPHIPP